MKTPTKLLAAALAVSMTAGPVLAQGAPPPAAEEARSGADMVQASALRGGFIIPLIALLAIILGILAATDSGRDPPRSP
ncbi:MAG: hypothetical protein ACT4OE_04425 [Sphingosinicella sp.]